MSVNDAVIVGAGPVPDSVTTLLATEEIGLLTNT